MVEYGCELPAHGIPLMKAAVEASRRRLRPILLSKMRLAQERRREPGDSALP
jgi:multidrug efflux pump subunit AcrB